MKPALCRARGLLICSPCNINIPIITTLYKTLHKFIAEKSLTQISLREKSKH